MIVDNLHAHFVRKRLVPWFEFLALKCEPALPKKAEMKTRSYEHAVKTIEYSLRIQ